MKKTNILFLIPALALLSFSGCSDNNVKAEDALSSSSSALIEPLSSGGVMPLESSSSLEDPLNPLSSSSVDPLNPLSSSSGDPLNPLSSSSVAPLLSSSSSFVVPPASSSSIEGPVSYEKLTASNAKSGWATRYWDACKPHCSWRENIDTNAVPFSICRNCSFNNEEIPAFTLSPNVSQYWSGYEGTKNSCDGGVAYTCFDMAPIAINDTLAYAFGAAPGADESSCGKCFQLQFDGHGKNGDKQAHTLLKGKTLILMSSNIGHDVGSGQIDVMIPGGGVGAFDALSKQIGVAKDDLGVGFGGLLSTCQQEIGNWDAPAAQFQDCVAAKCRNLFGKDPKHADLLRGCLWSADWFEAADNPTYLYKEVECPAYLVNKYNSTINTNKDNELSPYK